MEWTTPERNGANAVPESRRRRLLAESDALEMRVLAEIMGIVVAVGAFVFCAPPVFGFLKWAFGNWLRLWMRLYGEPMDSRSSNAEEPAEEACRKLK